MHADASSPREGLISLRRILICLILLWGYILLFVLWQHSQNGRYALHDDGMRVIVFDTRTGELSFPKQSP